MKRLKIALLLSVLGFSMLFITPILLPQTAESAQAATIKLSKKKATLIKGDTLKLKVTGTKKKVQWKSSKKAVATVDSKGKVKAKKKGKTDISAKVAGKTLKCKITVETPKLNKTSIELTEGQTYQLKVKGTTKKIKWSSDDKKIAKVGSNGKVLAVDDGMAIITAKIGTHKYSCDVWVSEAKKEEQKQATPETPPVSPIVANTQKLKNYIIQNGDVNSQGDKYIKDVSYTDDSTATWGIAYDSNNDLLQFIFLHNSNDGSSTAAINMIIDASTSSYATPEFVYLQNNTDQGCHASTQINVRTYKTTDTVSFYVKEKSTFISNNTIQTLGNAVLKVAFLGWDTLLSRQAKMNLSDIGFVSAP